MTNLETITLKAPAKINIGLRVLNQREDGFHNILTIFQRINLLDVVKLKKTNTAVIYRGIDLTLDPADNLCVIAAEYFRREFNISKGVDIHLEKRIPVGAGLGGGSSDAASTIIGMNKLFDTGLTLADLLKLGLEIGSDVPFFILNTSAMIASGRGEQFEKVNGLNSDYWVLIIYPNFEISTAWAYSCLGKHLTLEKKNNNLFDREFLGFQGEIPTANMGNDFEYPVFDAHPELSRERDRLLVAGAKFAMLSGSGSSLYGVFDGETEARDAALESPFGLSFVCRPY